MEVGDKLKELNMSVGEMERFTKAFKDEKFRKMLRDYAQELADPENKKKYEEEIKLLEQERGNTIEFLHPEPFKALKTSVNGKQKCFINICANEKVGKPESKWGVSEDGRRGQCWSLPHSLHPGRQDTDTKGNKTVIYDVIFHPDTLYIASKNTRFMDMVENTAIQGIQKAFKVTLDKNNVSQMRTKYKGIQQPCVIRKPIPGYKTREPSEEPDPLAFPYPDDRGPASLQTKPTESSATENGSDVKPTSFHVQHQKAEEPTQPNYTVKYRSFIDLQDFRCSRDSAQSPRPKEIVITINIPLLKAVADASLEVQEGRLLLETKKPAYRLELPLAYPVDEDKGEAKFDKQRGQLTVTLPVIPSKEAFDFVLGPLETGVCDSEIQEEKLEVKENKWVHKEGDGQKNEEEEEQSGFEEEGNTEEEDAKQQTCVEKGEEEEESSREKGNEQMRGPQEGVMRVERVVGEKGEWSKQEREGENGEDDKTGVEKEAIRKGRESVEEEKLKEQKQNEKVGKFNLQKRQQDEVKRMNKDNKLREDGCDGAVETKRSGATSCQCDTVDQKMDVSAEEENCAPSPLLEKQPVLITAEHSGCKGKEGEVNLNSEMTLVIEEPEKTKDTLHGNLMVEKDAAFLHHRSSEESQTAAADNTQSQNSVKDGCVSQRTEESSKVLAPDEADKPDRGGPGNRVPLLSEELTEGSVRPKVSESVDEDDLPTEQIPQNPEQDKPPPALLREIDKDGNEKVISDHSTSPGFVLQNSLMYELD